MTGPNTAGRLARWALAHRRLVVVGWVAVAVAGMFAAGPASNALTRPFSAPGREAFRANDEIA